MGARVIRDNIHGDIKVSKNAMEVIKQPLFQRLKNIKQNGFLHLVYPGVKHSRFEHSLGAYHLAGRLFDNIISDFKETNDWEWADGVKEYKVPAVEIQETRKFLTDFIRIEDNKLEEYKEKFQLAALMHDIGHGPYSHTFETLGLIKKENFQHKIDCCSVSMNWYNKQVTKPEHEEIGLLFIDQILSEIGLESYFQAIAAMVCKDLRPSILHDMQEKKQDIDVLFVTLFAPFVSGLADVDRLDYIVRDSKMAGIPYGQVEVDRLLYSLKPVFVSVEKEQTYTSGIFVRSKHRHTLDHFIFCLYQMYTQLYLHPTAVRLEHEFKQVVKASDELKKIDMEWYSGATDATIHETIEHPLNQVIMDSFGRRNRDDSKVSVQLTQPSESLKEHYKNWHRIEDIEREVVKGEDKVFLVDTADGTAGSLLDWHNESILKELSNDIYTPKIYWNNKEFKTALEQAAKEISKAS